MDQDGVEVGAAGEAPTFRTLATGLGFTEGVVVRPSGEIVVTSLDHACLYRLGQEGDTADVIAHTGGTPNGATEGLDGSIYMTQTGGVWRNIHKPAPGFSGGVQVLRPGGWLEWLTIDPISPNDLCFGPDGYLYVTDPTRWGRWDDARLWRCDLVSGEAELLISVDWYANGIGFGLEDDALYVSDTAGRRVVRYPLDGGRLGKPEVAVQQERGWPDGFAFDTDGNMVIASISLDDEPGDLQVFSPDGKLLELLRPTVSKMVTNVALTPEGLLLVTDSSAGAVLAADWPTSGLLLHPSDRRRAGDGPPSRLPRYT
jgi:gluconolactonase